MQADAFERPLQDEDPEVRAIAGAFVRVPYRPDPVAAYDLKTELADRNRSTRRHAASELERLRYPEALPALIKVIEEGDAQVRRAPIQQLTTAESIRRLRGTPEAEALRRALQVHANDADAEMQYDVRAGLRALEQR